jgi:hypothetical protein
MIRMTNVVIRVRMVPKLIRIGVSSLCNVAARNRQEKTHRSPPISRYGRAMHMVRFVLVLACGLALGACSSSDSSTKQIDAAAAVDVALTPDATPDAAAALCTGAVYDTCTVNTECASQNCRLYAGASLQVCTQTCSATVPCPNDSAGATVVCNGMGNCKPSVANPCHR